MLRAATVRTVVVVVVSCTIVSRLEECQYRVSVGGWVDGCACTNLDDDDFGDQLPKSIHND
jgi:hypothetical protein